MKKIKLLILIISISLFTVACGTGGGGGGDDSSNNTPAASLTSDIRTYQVGDSFTYQMTVKDTSSGQEETGDVTYQVTGEVTNTYGIICKVLSVSGILSGPGGSSAYTARALFHQDSDGNVYDCGAYSEHSASYIYITDTPFTPNGLKAALTNPVNIGDVVSGTVFFDNGSWADCTETITGTETVSTLMGRYETYIEEKVCSYPDGTTDLTTSHIYPAIYYVEGIIITSDGYEISMNMKSYTLAPSPPSISNLQYSPQSAGLNEGGGVVTVDGTIDFSDAEGNVSNLRLQVRDSGNALVHDSNDAIVGFNGVTAGTIDFQLTFDTTFEDDYSFEIAIIDSQGFVSNVHTGSFSVVDSNAPATITFTPTSLTITDATAGIIWDTASFIILVRNANGAPLSNVNLEILFPFARSAILTSGYYVELLDNGVGMESPMQVTTGTNGTYVLNFRYQRGGGVAYISDISVSSGTYNATATFTVAAS